MPPKEMPTLDDLKRMADKKAAAAAGEVEVRPEKPATLESGRLGLQERSSIQGSRGYFEKSLQFDPKNIGSAR